MAIPSQVLIAMGVSGVGKSTIAEALNEHLHWPFKEGDELHPPSNVQKMHAGMPLDDTDREPWLRTVAAWIRARRDADEPGIITCSALKRAYRDKLIDGDDQVRLLYLKADRAVLLDRLENREGHFMPPSLLNSQLATLEEPTPDEHPYVILVHGDVEAIVGECLDALEAGGEGRPEALPLDSVTR